MKPAMLENGPAQNCAGQFPHFKSGRIIGQGAQKSIKKSPQIILATI
jgi:hypothetical protein